MSSINCAEHGKQAVAVVCHHTFESMHDNRRRGLHWTVFDDGDVEAFCDECAAYLDAIDGDPTEQELKFLDAKVVCIRCFEGIKALNSCEGTA